VPPSGSPNASTWSTPGDAADDPAGAGLLGDQVVEDLALRVGEDQLGSARSIPAVA
jgi:hypothetical protein